MWRMRLLWRAQALYHRHQHGMGSGFCKVRTDNTFAHLSQARVAPADWSRARGE